MKGTKHCTDCTTACACPTTDEDPTAEWDPWADEVTKEHVRPPTLAEIRAEYEARH